MGSDQGIGEFTMRRISLALVLMLGAGRAAATGPVIGGCAVLPANNAWNTRIDQAVVDPHSDAYIANINANGGHAVHPDFGSDPSYGIPYVTVGASQANVPVSFDYAEESDPGPYPIPSNAPVEGGGVGDSHVLVVDTATCVLYELYAAQYQGSDAAGWHAGSGAVWPLKSNKERPQGWTSADAAGLPILPGLARCDEANSGHIDHAFRFTVNRTRKAYVYPASHVASSQTGADYPPMGLRLRLKASYDTSTLDGQAGAIATALKQYGMILADNGSNWYISGETNPSCWNDDDLNRLKAIPGTAFEVVVSPPPPSDIAGDLLANGGFEAAKVASAKPAFWASAYKATRLCDDPNVPRHVAAGGQCVLRLAGVSGYTSKVTQTIASPPAGKLQLQLKAKAVSVPAGAAQALLTLFYGNGTAHRYTLALPSGSTTFQSLSLAATPTQAVDHASVSLSYTAATGHMDIDQVALRALATP
jgi:hypothetical protein